MRKTSQPCVRGCYGDFETLNTQIIDCTTTQNMCLGCPKRPRSSRNSKVDRRSARTKAVQNVRSARPPWHVVARALTRACKLSSTSQSAGESTLNPGTDPAPLQPTAYTCPRPNYVPTAQMCASNNTATWQHKIGAHSCSHCPGRHARSKRTDSARLGRQGQPSRCLPTRSPPGSPRPLERSPTAPGSSRPQVDGSRLILSTVPCAAR